MSGRRYVIFEGKRSGMTEYERVSDGPDRRRHTRRRIGVFTEIHREGTRPVPSITFNMSRSGVLLLTLSKLEPGEQVRLAFVGADDDRETAEGVVVHDAPMHRSSLWRQRVGVKFTGDVPNFFESELSHGA